jgi:hypothetical protein
LRILPLHGLRAPPRREAKMSWSGLPERIERKIMPEPNSGCWLWIGVAYTTGYGCTVKTVDRQRKYILVHKYVFELLRHKVPSHLQIDHLCRNRICCNPDHLEPVTPRENYLRGFGVGAINARKTHCGKGHPLEGEHIYPGQRKRRCIVCSREGNMLRSRIYRSKK